jgi:hypothetical protein
MKKIIMLCIGLFSLSISVFCSHDASDSDTIRGLETSATFTKDALNAAPYSMDIHGVITLQKYINEIRDRAADETGLHTQSHIELNTLLTNLKLLKTNVLHENANNTGFAEYGLGFAYRVFDTDPRIVQINHYINQVENAITIIQLKDRTSIEAWLYHPGTIFAAGAIAGTLCIHLYTKGKQAGYKKGIN